jgi:hypothetical protein
MANAKGADMTPLKLSAIDQEHLQELYDASGIARDELPYTESFEQLWVGFQDRTFKNAGRDQVYAALLKYTRSSSNASKPSEPLQLTDDQKKSMKVVASKHASGGKLLPYTPGFEAALKEFNRVHSLSLTEHDFWRTLSGSSKRRPPRPPSKAVKQEVDDDVE